MLPCLAHQQYGAALAIIVVNRLFDGLDGAIARRAGTTLFGGYLDFFCDAVFYAAVPLGFALADPRYGLWAALLLATFVCTMTSFLSGGRRGPARRGRSRARGRKSFFHAAGIIEGSETIAAFAVFCLFPANSHCSPGFSLPCACGWPWLALSNVPEREGPRTELHAGKRALQPSSGNSRPRHRKLIVW